MADVTSQNHCIICGLLNKLAAEVKVRITNLGYILYRLKFLFSILV